MGEGCRLVRGSRQADCGEIVRCGLVSGPVEAASSGQHVICIQRQFVLRANT